MVAGDAHDVADIEVDLLLVSRLVLLERHLVVRVLSSVVVDVVERVKPTRRVRMQGLHDLISQAAHLSIIVKILKGKKGLQ